MFLRNLILLLYIFVSGRRCQNTETRVTLFNKNNFMGQNETMKIPGCVSLLTSPFYKNIRSISTHDGCVHLYSGPNCTEEYRIVKPGSEAHHLIDKLTFHSGKSAVDNIQSIGPCSDPCKPAAKAAVAVAEQTSEKVAHSCALSVFLGVLITFLLTVGIGGILIKRNMLKLTSGNEPAFNTF